jgi:hypothetical protein
LKKCDWNVETKEQAIEEIKKNDYMAGWIITEVMRWGTPIDYAKKYKVENDEDEFIIKINERYFAPDYENIHYFKEVIPRKVIIEKFIYEAVKNNAVLPHVSVVREPVVLGMETEFKPDGELQIIHENGQPYGIRDKGGYLLFFPKVSKYTGQEQRYIEEIQECYSLADKIVKALKQ